MKKAVVACVGIVAIVGLAAYLQNGFVLWAFVLLLFLLDEVE